jgi:hypothetical protein
LKLPKHRDGDGENEGVSDDIEYGADIEVLRLECACSWRERSNLPVVRGRMAAEGNSEEDCDVRGSAYLY